MSDRELLELAAKACQGKLISSNPFGELYQIGSRQLFWSPLTDGSDALRLATDLNIDIMFFNGFQEVICGGQGDNDDNIIEPYGEDIQAAVRRCIVRAAAEIGRAMP